MFVVLVERTKLSKDGSKKLMYRVVALCSFCGNVVYITCLLEDGEHSCPCGAIFKARLSVVSAKAFNQRD